ncbi:MAG: hypothetical protein PHR53_07585 [Bacteroidales bacterium]|nr:hypothetical protein [Bacteroidales bacterium]
MKRKPHPEKKFHGTTQSIKKTSRWHPFYPTANYFSMDKQPITIYESP